MNSFGLLLILFFLETISEMTVLGLRDREFVTLYNQKLINGSRTDRELFSVFVIRKVG